MGRWYPEDALLSYDRRRTAMDRIPLPPNFHRTDERAAWSRWDGEFNGYTRHWLVDGDAQGAQAQLRAVLEAQGFVLGGWGTDMAEPGTATAEGHRDKCKAKGHRDRLRVLIGVDTRWAWKDGEKLTLAPGQVGVTAVLEATRR